MEEYLKRRVSEMKKMADYLVGLAVLSTLVGIVSRFTQPILGVFANAFLQFASVCALIAIAIYLRQK